MSKPISEPTSVAGWTREQMAQRLAMDIAKLEVFTNRYLLQSFRN